MNKKIFIISGIVLTILVTNILFFFDLSEDNVKENIDSSETIQLPKNTITMEECGQQGGEVFNILEKTSYEGELIGTIEGLRCPCACRID